MAGIAVLTAAYVLSQFYRSFLAVLTPALTTELDATKADLSTASGAWFIMFALMQFVVGISLDRYGPRRTAAFLLGICGGGGAFLFAVAFEPWMLTVAMALIGIGCSPVLMASLFIFAKTYSPARFAVLTSWLVGIGTMGNVVGAAPLASAAEAFGWREVMAGLGVVTVLIAAATFSFVRDPETAGEEPSANSGLAGYLELFRMRVLWPIFPLTALCYAPAAGIRGLWAGPYLADVFGAEALLIGQATLFMALAMVAGSFLYGPLDTIFGTRKWVAMIGNSVSVAALFWLAAFPDSTFANATIVLAVIGLFGGGFGLMMAHGRAFLPPHLTGRGVTLLNFFAVGGVGAMQFATGAVFTASAVPAEPVEAYRWLFLFYAVMLALSVFIYLWARDAPPEKMIRSAPRPAE